MNVIIDGKRYIAEREFSLHKTPFNELIKAARKNADESLEEAAIAIGTTKSRMHELEKGGTMPRLPMLQKILKHYGLRFDDIADV